MSRKFYKEMVILFQFWKCWRRSGITHECRQTVRNSTHL